MERTKVFISYSHEDRRPMERLKVFLRHLEREGKIDSWDDSKILSGSKWREEIAKAIDACKVAVLFISADFLASDFIIENELPPLLEAADKQGAVILSIIVSPVDLSDTILEQFQAVNSPDSPLIGLSRKRKEEVFLNAFKRIKGIFKEIYAPKPKIDLDLNKLPINQNVEQRAINTPAEPVIFDAPFQTKPANPRFLAEFVTDSKGKIRTYQSGYTHFQIRLFIENAPPDTKKVVYELHDSYAQPICEVEEGKDFEEFISSYGDYVVNIDIVGSEILEVNEWLSKALENFYGDSPNEEIAQAIKTIKKY